MKKMYLSLLAATCMNLAVAQNSITAKYNYQLPDDIEMMEVAPGGLLLVGSADGLSGIEAHSDKVLYTYTKMGKIKPEEIQIIPNTTYITLARGFSKIIVDYTTGKEVFTATENGWGAIMSITPDFTNNTITMLGSAVKGGYIMGVYDLETFAKRGVVEFTDKKTMGAYINALTYFESEGKLFVRTEKGMVCIDKEKISIDWVYSDLDKSSGIIKVIADPVKGEYYIAESNNNDHFLHKLDGSGKLPTKKPTKLAGMPQHLAFTEKGLFVHTADLKTTYFQIFDRSTATPVWKKPYEVEGAIFMTEIKKDRMIYAAQNGAINTLDFTTGKQVLKKDIKTGMMYKNVSLLSDDQIFFLSSKDMGVADLKTGEYVKEPTKFKKVTNMIAAYDNKNERLVVSTGTELFFIKTDGSSQKIADLKFKEDETPTKIEFRESGILVGASQNNLLVSYEGKVVYESYFKAPGQSLAAKIAMGTLAAAAAASNQNMMDRGYKGDGSGAAGMENEMKKKFKATSGTKNHLFILTKLDDGVGLVKLNKDTGKKEAELVLKDKKPEYKVDDVYGVLYYKKDKKVIVGYDLR